ncbi:MAG: type II secretion system GspH family protein [Candidatus Nomurabacteria bacterium]|nr:type II secretion system GspH family protein [Candidatus Nomurabacteria bacterium]
MKREDGFTVIELVIFFVILAVLAVFFVIQKLDLDASYKDQDRKIAVNAMYYSLTEVFYEENRYYPSEIEDDTLWAIDPELLYDPWGIFVGEADGDYRYEGLDCDNNGRCKKFKLTAELEKEAEYVREVY